MKKLQISGDALALLAGGSHLMSCIVIIIGHYSKESHPKQRKDGERKRRGRELMGTVWLLQSQTCLLCCRPFLTSASTATPDSLQAFRLHVDCFLSAFDHGVYQIVWVFFMVHTHTHTYSLWWGSDSWILLRVFHSRKTGSHGAHGELA